MIHLGHGRRPAPILSKECTMKCRTITDPAEIVRMFKLAKDNRTKDDTVLILDLAWDDERRIKVQERELDEGDGI